MVHLNRDNVRRVIASVDWGFTNPGALQVWATDSDGRMYLVHEVYQTHKTIDWWIAKAKEAQSTFSPEVFVCDPSEPGYIQQFKQAGLRAIGASNDVTLGIQRVQMRLAIAGDGRPRLYLLYDAMGDPDIALQEGYKPTSARDEFPAYVWQETKDGRPNKEQPLKANDHAMDATRYAVMHLDAVQPVVQQTRNRFYA